MIALTADTRMYFAEQFMFAKLRSSRRFTSEETDPDERPESTVDAAVSPVCCPAINSQT